MGGLGAALVGSEEPGHRVEPGVCPGLTCPREVDKAKAKGRVRVDRPIPSRPGGRGAGGFSGGGGGTGMWQWFAVLLGPTLPGRLSLPLSQGGD